MKSNTIQWASYMNKYKVPILISAVCNFGYAIFTLVSIPLLIPFFKLLFGQSLNNDGHHNYLETKLNSFFATIIESAGTHQALLWVCIGFIGAILCRNIFRYLSLYILAATRNEIIADIRDHIYRAIFHLPHSYFTEARKGDLIATAMNDVQEIEWSVLNVVEAIFRSPILLIGSLGIMLIINASLTGMVFLLIFITVVVLRIIARSLKRQSKGVQEQIGKISSLFEETISGVYTIKSFVGEKLQVNKFQIENQDFKNKATKALRTRDLSAPISESLGMIIVGILMYLGAKSVFMGDMEPASFFAFLFAFYQVIEPAKALSNSYFNIQKGLGAVDRVNHILSQVEDIYTPEHLTWKGLQNTISFHNVSFAYKEEEGNVLQSLSFSILKGQKVAIVGSSGSGKSTISHLLNRFEIPQHGQILMDGIDINTIDLAAYRKQLGWVSQDAFLFNDTIAHNITLNDPDADEVRIIQALNKAYAMDFVNDLPNGIHTQIGDAGIRLSGGQKQRLSIARAIYHQPQIMILDEATSSLDSISEEIVQQSIDNLIQGKTTVIIAHRLSTIRNADIIFVLHEGKIAIHGSHTSLLQESSIYNDLINKQ